MKITAMSIGESKYPLLIFLLTFIVFNITTTIQFSSDVKPASLLPFLILKHHTLYFDNAMPFILNQSNGWGSTYNLVEINGHWFSNYPIATSVICLPLYILHMLCMVAFNGGFEYYSVLSKSCASLMMAFASTLFYMVCEKVFSKRTAIITTIIFAFGTLTWAISSQSLWQHGTSELLLIIMLLCIVRNETRQSVGNFVIIGICSGLFIFNRPSDIFLLIPVLWYVYKNRSCVYAFLFWCCISAFPFLWYNISSFGSPFGGYGSMGMSIVTTPIPWWNFINGVCGLLFSPNRGLFVFSPILILSLWGMYVVYKEKSTMFLLIFIPCMISSLLFYSIHIDSLLGGWTYGPRYLIAMLPILCIFVGYGLEKVKGKVWIIITVLLVFSIGVQAIGAWGYTESTWNQRSNLHDRNRVWDMKDLIIVDSFWSMSKVQSVSLFVWPTLPPPWGYFVLWEK